MTASTINQQLQAIYQPYLDKLYKKEWPTGNTPSSPLLMHVFDEYVTMPGKIMFVGQETHGWCETAGLSHRNRAVFFRPIGP